MKKKINKLDLIKIKSLCFVKDIVKGIRRLATYWKKIFAKDTAVSFVFPENTKNS